MQQLVEFQQIYLYYNIIRSNSIFFCFLNYCSKKSNNTIVDSAIYTVDMSVVLTLNLKQKQWNDRQRILTVYNITNTKCVHVHPMRLNFT